MLRVTVDVGGNVTVEPVEGGGDHPLCASPRNISPCTSSRSSATPRTVVETIVGENEPTTRESSSDSVDVTVRVKSRKRWALLSAAFGAAVLLGLAVVAGFGWRRKESS